MQIIFSKSTMKQTKPTPGRPRPRKASPGVCEVSETNFSSDQLAADESVETGSTGLSGELTAESASTHPFSPLDTIVVSVCEHAVL